MNTSISKNISKLRKQKNVTQEQMAQELNLSAQAISKWETNTCMPDTLTLPLIASYFNVSIDYLFYGKDVVYDDILQKVNTKIVDMGQFNGFEEALKIFAFAHHGLSCNNLFSKKELYDTPAHISDKHGVSLLSGKGYGAIITRRFFENICLDTVDFSIPIFKALSIPEQQKIILGIILMDDISFHELKKLLNFDEETLQSNISALIESKIIREEKSKHSSLGTTYHINNMYHSGICIIVATMEMIRYSMKGISCCMGYGDFPICFNQNGQ